ncbi:MAG TPA: hypothetical protein DEQ47_04195 [Solibacterales bacterium]|jgi:hypothetical protein|nr:hypothetical protein [Bryobacterales bacterium]
MSAAALTVLAALLSVAEPCAAIEPAKPAIQSSGPPASLLTIQRVYVDHLGAAMGADEVRDILMSTLMRDRLFALTENEERADAFLRGTASDVIFEEEHESSDSINGHVQTSLSTGGSYSTRANSRGASASVGDAEHARSTERRHQSMAAVRLVNRDGDVLWATTQESGGAKFRGATADVADKVARALAEDVRQARAAAAMPPKLKAAGPGAR